MAALLCRGDWPWVAAGAALAWLLYALAARRRMPALSDAVRRAFPHAAKPLLALNALALLFLAALLSQQIGTLFPQTAGLRWVGLGVLALAAFAAHKGLAVVLRCGAVLFVPLALILGAVPLLAAHGATLAWLAPRGDVLGGACALLLFLLPAALSCFVPEIRVQDAKPRRWMGALGLAAVLGAAVCAACLSPQLAAGEMSFYLLARSVSVFGVMLRLESFVSGALTASAFSALALLLLTAKKLLSDCIKDVSVWYFAIIAGGASLLPADALIPISLFSAIFCALFPVLAQGLAVGRESEKKSDFFEKNA